VGRLGAAQCCPALVQAADPEKEPQATAAGRAGGIRGESRSSGRRRTGAGGGKGVRRGMEARDGSSGREGGGGLPKEKKQSFFKQW